MRKEPKWLEAGDSVEWQAIDYNPNNLYPRNGFGVVVRKLNPDVETYPYEVEVRKPESHQGQRFCFRGSELYRALPDA